MLSRTLASGAMLFTMLGLTGFVVFDEFGLGNKAAPAAGVAVVNSSSSSPAADSETGTSTAVEVAAVPERPATAPQRVVESAGFPLVPETPAAEAAETDGTAGPTVTINGQPLGSSWAPARAAVTETSPQSQSAGNEIESVALAETLVAPTPIPRPAGLELSRPENRPAVDYEAITASAFPDRGWMSEPVPQPSPQPQAVPQNRGPELVGPVGVVDGFMSWEERQRVTGTGVPSPQDQGLVQVAGPNGQMLWVYPDQAYRFDRRPVQIHSDPFAMVFD